MSTSLKNFSTIFLNSLSGNSSMSSYRISDINNGFWPLFGGVLALSSGAQLFLVVFPIALVYFGEANGPVC